jgi:hypothetical protein
MKQRTARKKSSCTGAANIEQCLQHVYNRNSCSLKHHVGAVDSRKGMATYQQLHTMQQREVRGKHHPAIKKVSATNIFKKRESMN